MKLILACLSRDIFYEKTASPEHTFVTVTGTTVLGSDSIRCFQGQIAGSARQKIQKENQKTLLSKTLS